MKKIISFFISYCQPKVYSSLLFALYTTVKIPNQPSNIVRPWIKEYKASVKNLIIQDVKKCNIEMFFAIYNQFKITVLGVNTIHDYFSTYEPADNVSLLDDIWQSLFKIIFTLEAFPKGSLKKVKVCLKFDLPSYGMKLEEPELSDSNIYNFMNFVETSVRTVFKFKLQSNLAKILDYITPLRLPSLLYLTLMDPICKGITPENSIINTSDKNHIQIKHIIISLNVFCLKSLTASFTLEQISTSVKHIFVFKLFYFLIKSLNLHDIAFSSFPAILIPILLFYDKYTKLLTGFNGYGWKFDEIKIYIDFCKRSQSLLVRKYEKITSKNCTLEEYCAIEKNLLLINEIFKYSDNPAVSSADLDTYILMFTRSCNKIKNLLFSDLCSNSNDIACIYFIDFLLSNEINVPQTIENDIEALFINEIIYTVPGLVHSKNLKFGPNKKIPLILFEERCNQLYSQFSMFTVPITDDTNVDIHQFISYFSSRNNLLFNACLLKCLSDIKQLKENNGKNTVLTMTDFAQCAKECFTILLGVCNAEITYADILEINKYLLLEKISFEKIHYDLKNFVLFTDIVQEELRFVDIFKLLKISAYLPHLINVCKIYELSSCLNSSELLAIQNILKIIHNKKERDALTLQDATTILGNIASITCDMPLNGLSLFPILADSVEFYRFLKDNNFYTSKTNFDTYLNLVTSDKQVEGEFKYTILSHLQIAYNFMIPLFDTNIAASSFFKQYSEMNIGVESKYSQLKTVNSNILLIRRWFIETADNLLQQLHDILKSGKYEIFLSLEKSATVNSDLFDTEHVRRSHSCLPDVLSIYSTSSINLSYSGTTKTHINFKNDAKSPLKETINEKMDMYKVSEFLRKLSFLEQNEKNLNSEEIYEFKFFHNKVLDLFELFSDLHFFGHPNYQEKLIEYECSTSIVKIEESLSSLNKILDEWTRNYKKIQDDSIYLLFFPIKRIIYIVSLLDNQKWSMAFSQILFLMNNNEKLLTLLQDRIECIYFDINSNLEMKLKRGELVSPAEKLDSLFRRITDSQLFCTSLKVSCKTNLTISIQNESQIIYRVYSYSQRQLLNLLAYIYKIQKEFKSFEILKCHRNLSKEELTLFLKRTKVFTSNTYTLLEVNCLPNYLQEHTMRHIAESHKDNPPIANINYIETAQSLLHELPGVNVINKESIKTISDDDLQIDYVRFDLIKKQNIFRRIELVYGLDGNGKSHYIWNEIKTKKYTVIAINEAFDIPSVIQKMIKLVSFDKDVCIYFNVTITCLEPDNTGYDQYTALMHKLNWFFFDLLVLNHISDSNSPLSFSIPCGLRWNLFVEVPSRINITNPYHNISKFLDDIPILHVITVRKCIWNQPYVVDDGVQLVCKYLCKYDQWKKKKVIGVNQHSIKDRVVKFSSLPEQSTSSCLSLLEKHMSEHVKIRKITQKLFVCCMIRRCIVIDQLHSFNNFLSLNPEQFLPEERKYLNTLGVSIPDRIMLGNRDMLEKLLCNSLGLADQSVVTNLIDEESYILNADIVLKMLSIHERRMCRFPLIIEGETGVGKTKLLDILSKLWNRVEHQQYHTTLCSIINIVRNKIDDVYFRKVVVTEVQTDMLDILDFHDNLLANVCPSMDVIEKSCSLLGSEIITTIQKFSKSPAFHLFQLDFNAVKMASNTKNVKYISEILRNLLTAKPLDTFYKFNIHSSLTPKVIKTRFNDIIKLSRKLIQNIDSNNSLDFPYPIVTVFLDEINTSSCMGLFKEIIIDNSIDGEPLPDNIFIVSACNPHRSYTIEVKDDPMKENWVLGWYNVRPLHPTLSRIIWGYGSLNDAQEEEYIKQKLSTSSLSKDIPEAKVTLLGAEITYAQQLVRNLVSRQLCTSGFTQSEAQNRSKSSVSQRDIQRVFTISEFIYSLLVQDNTYLFFELQKAVIVAIGLVYYFRLDSGFRDVFTESINEKFHLNFKDVLYTYIADTVNKVQVPIGIAKTIALQENLFANIICLICKIPLIIIGDPGTSSETLSFKLAISNVRGIESPNEYFRDRRFPVLEQFYYQCSRKSTSLEIENVFKKAIARQAQLDKAKIPVLSLVFMDDVGLLEESLNMLHYYLDRPKVSFIAISNHILDATKSNRAINLYRPRKQDKNDLLI